MDFSGDNSYNLAGFGLAPGDKSTCTSVHWADNYINCPVTYTAPPPAPNNCPNINPLPDRYKVASLNPLIQEVSQRYGQIADPYDPRYFHGRTSLAQLLWLDLKNGSGGNNRSKDRYTRFIPRPQDAFCNQQKLAKGAVPAYTHI
jgi:hypothetical protein